jgi:3',5'-cyclic-AMP phosphodiesterase
MRQVFADYHYLQTNVVDAEHDCMQYAINLNGVRLVTVDTVVPMASYGEVSLRRLDHLAQLLAADKHTPTIVAMHHPPFRTYIGHMDKVGLLKGADALQKLIAAHPQVQRVICGHLHRPIQALWAGTIAMTAPSTAHQVCLDLDDDAASAFVMEPPGYLIHSWDSSGSIITHHAVIGDFDGPHPFFEDGQLID